MDLYKIEVELHYESPMDVFDKVAYVIAESPAAAVCKMKDFMKINSVKVTRLCAASEIIK